MTKRAIIVALPLVFSMFNQVSSAAEVATSEERAYFSHWSHQQDLKFPRTKRGLILANGLEALLIQDPRASKAAVALDVGVGSADDPTDLLGLAHYLEHMVFVSTLKYPEVNGFDKFTADHNGESNAFTDNHHTNYHFDVHPVVLKEALDRFAQFFVSPTFDPSQLSHELEAVDAEYQKNYQQDSWGLSHVLGSLANPAHPHFRDFQGNKETLAGVTQARISEFFHQHYSSDLMKLVVISPHDLSEVEDWVRASFGAVKKRGSSPVRALKVSYFRPGSLPRLITYKGMEAKKQLSLEFELPSFDEFKYSSPHTFLSELISSDREGMLRDHLMKKGWISQLSARQGDLETSQLFGVEFQLTDLGRAHWQDIIFEFYQAIALLRQVGIPRYLFDEYRLQGELHLTHASPSHDMDRASVIAGRLQNWSVEELEGLESLSVRYAPDTFEGLLEFIRPEKMQVLLTDSELSVGTQDPFYAMEYHVQALTRSDLDRWSHVPVNDALVFPEPNPFRPADLSLRGVTDEGPVLFNSPGTRLWIQTDHEFGIPKAALAINLLTHRTFTPHQVALRTLYTEAVEQAVKTVLSRASAFGYQFNLQPSQTGYSLYFSGFSDGFERFFGDVVATLGLSAVTEVEFLAIRERLLNEVEDELTEAPYGIAHDRFRSIVGGGLTLADLKSGLTSSTRAEVVAFANELWQGEQFIHAAAFGNITHDAAQRLLNHLKSTMKHPAVLPQEAVLLEKFVAFEKARSLVHETFVEDHNHGVEHYVSFGRTTPSKRVMLEALELLMANQFFKDLRTEGQIGYVARLKSYLSAGQCGVGVLVQSSWPVEKVDAACLGWLAQMPKRLAAVSPESFAQVKASLLAELRKPVTTFEDKAARTFAGVFDHREHFDWKQTLVHLLEGLEQHELVSWVSHQLDPARRRLLSVYAIGSQESSSVADDVGVGQKREREESGSETSGPEESGDRERNEPASAQESVLGQGSAGFPSPYEGRDRITTEEFSRSSRKYEVPRFR
jgi:secreted Zn-dependent insulinase-like peptidase